MKKIGLFIDKWESGGIEMYILNTLESLSDEFNFEIITTKKKSNLYDDKLVELDVPLIELNTRVDSEITRTIYSLKKFWEVLREKNYDILHLHIYNAFSLIYARLAKLAGVGSIICHSHNSGIAKNRLRLLKISVHYVSKYLFKNSFTYAFACSDLAAKWMFVDGQSYFFAINGINTKKFDYDKKFKDFFRESSNEIILGNIGRFVPEKNQMFLINIADSLAKNQIPFKLIIVGEGPLKEKLYDQIKEFNLYNNIILLPPQREITKLLSGFDIFLMPSLFEGFPITLVEAQANGLPIIYSNTITKKIEINDNIYRRKIKKNLWLDMIMYKKMQRTDNLRINEFDLKVTMNELKDKYNQM